MPQRLFQDVAGTIPAVLPGDPVGLSIRAAGDVNATQGVALAKPTLVRWPATGRRNLANGAQAVDNPVYWQNQYTSNGVTVTLVNSGLLPDGTPFCRYNLSGTVASSPIRIGYIQNNSRIQLGADRARVAKASIAVPVGDLEAFGGCRCDIQLVVNETYLSTVSGNPVKSREPQISQAAFDGISNPTATHASVSVALSASVGSILNHEVEVFGLQFERGSVATPLQLNYGPNNITEPGVPDKWHLYNDGGDSLSTVLPAGTYGTAHLIVDGSYTFGTVVSDGVTPITTIPNDRQVDCIYRLGAFNAEEQSNILAYWQRKFPQ